MDFTKFLLSLDFLYLLNKIEVSERGLIRCISKG
ncbi:TPA: ABC-three component system middle component 6 [Streptococcus agalactiae]